MTWQTDAGITCSYNPQLERISKRAQEPAQTEALESIPALRGVQHGRDVYLFQPYYGLDSSFTRQYYEEGQRIAAKSEGTFYYYKTEAATVDAIADAVESGGVILFDSHGHHGLYRRPMRTTPPKRRRPTSACRAARA